MHCSYRFLLPNRPKKPEKLALASRAKSYHSGKNYVCSGTLFFSFAFCLLTLQFDFEGKANLFHFYFVGKHDLTSWAKVYHEVKTKERKFPGNFP